MCVNFVFENLTKYTLWGTCTRVCDFKMVHCSVCRIDQSSCYRDSIVFVESHLMTLPPYLASGINLLLIFVGMFIVICINVDASRLFLSVLSPGTYRRTFLVGVGGGGGENWKMPTEDFQIPTNNCYWKHHNSQLNQLKILKYCNVLGTRYKDRTNFCGWTFTALLAKDNTVIPLLLNTIKTP